MDGPVKTVIISGLELKAKDLTIADTSSGAAIRGELRLAIWKVTSKQRKLS